MTAHFTSFTPEAMRAFGHQLAADARRRTELIEDTRNRTSAMLAGFRSQHREAEALRRQRAEREADGRLLVTSELKSGVHALLTRFELGRKEMAGDLREMARDLHAACEAFRNRPGRPGARARGEGKPGHARKRQG